MRQDNARQGNITQDKTRQYNTRRSSIIRDKTKQDNIITLWDKAR